MYKTLLKGLGHAVSADCVAFKLLHQIKVPEKRYVTNQTTAVKETSKIKFWANFCQNVTPHGSEVSNVMFLM